MALEDWNKRTSGNIISYYKENNEIRIIYDYSLFIWKVVLLENDKYKERLYRTKEGGLIGKKQALKFVKTYMRKN